MYFTGNNLFGQWCDCCYPLVDRFKEFHNHTVCDDESNSHNLNLVHISWSHNIFVTDDKDKFYLVGEFKGYENNQRVVAVSLPEKIRSLCIVSNEYIILIVNKDTCTYWTINLENFDDIHKIKINMELPSINDAKKIKLADDYDCIAKCVLMNESLIFLTRLGLVYSGLLPSLIDTNHCIGKVIDVQCGYEHSVALTDIGFIYTWGNGRRLQLGHGDVSSYELPTLVEALAGIKIIKIAAGGWHSLALSEFGDLYAWGWNDTGQLGLKQLAKENSFNSCILPTIIDLFDEEDNEVNQRIVDIACGSRHSAILLENNTVWTSGCNLYGQLGFPKNLLVPYFKKAFYWEHATSVMSGDWSTIVV